jgi:DNA invertase Pin-like site-specific DNA recombinase
MTTTQRPAATALRVLGYVRVSTSKQEIGPEVQVAALEAEAARNGWELTIRREDAASAKSLDGRPVLAACLAELKAGRADVLAVSKLDRLSRSVADFSAILELADRQRWAVVALDLRVDTTTVTGRAMAQVTCTFAEMERRRIGERTREGMAKIKAETGKHMGRRAEVHPDVVDRIAAERAAGATYTAISEALNAEGHTTPTGRPWTPQRVRGVAVSVTAAAAR